MKVSARNAARIQLKPGTLARLLRCAFAVALLAVALACQRGLETLLLARFQIESVALDFLNDVLLQYFTLEAP